MSKKENVIVLGASDKPDRYSYKAIKMLSEKGHIVKGVHPRLATVQAIAIHPTVTAASKDLSSVDTVTLYLSPKRLTPVLQELIDCKPTRVIMNPGTEDNNIKIQLESAGILVQEACTLVLLSTEQF